MRVTGYVRVSTAAQSEEGVSLAAQRARILAWAAGSGHEVVAIHEDAGLSGALDVDGRPGLAAALRDVESGAAAGLVVCKLDRLARSVRVLLTIVEERFSRGAALVSLSEAIDTSTAMGKAFLGFVGIMAALERDLIAERTSDALQHLRSHGVRLGRAPLELRRSAERDLAGRLAWEADAGGRETVERVQALRAAGRSLRQIAATLTEEGRRTSRGGRWDPKTIARILDRACRAAEREAA